jgi:ATP-dependent protease HslVU (ClpYQ) peptidase subunit
MQALQPKIRPTIQQAKNIATKALTVATKFDPYTGAPFQTFTQDLTK